ncbi:MAG: hypothetical protein R6V17_02900 [Halanaerobacter sp.]
MKTRLYLLLMIISLAFLVTACNGIGNLRVNIYQGESLTDDAYVGLYTTDFKERLDFRYTTRGEVHFKALEEGSYGLKVIKNDQKKRLQVQITGDETNHLKVSLN